MPDPDSTRYGYQPPRPGGGGIGGAAAAIGGQLANTSTLYNAQQDQQYLNALQMALGGGMGGGGGGAPRQYVGGGGGGYGGGGPSAYDQWRIAEEKRRQAELEKQKKIMELALGGQKQAASAGIGQQHHDALRSITNSFNENKQATAQTQGQINQMGANMVGGSRQELAALRRDMQGQGGGGADMAALQGAANANITGQQFLQNNANSYNARLAQVMGGAKTDAYNTSDMIRQGGLGELENAYIQALMQIKLLGLA